MNPSILNQALCENPAIHPANASPLFATLAISVLTDSSLARTRILVALAIARLSLMMLAWMVMMGMWLSLDHNEEVLAVVADSVDERLISVWPLVRELFLLIVFGV